MRGTILCFPLCYVLAIWVPGKEALNDQVDKKSRETGGRDLQLPFFSERLETYACP